MTARPNSNKLDDYPTVGLLFPSKYLSADDLRGRDVTVVIEAIEPRHELQRTDGKDYKPVIRLRGKEKMWCLNKTNALIIADLYGRDARAWIGKAVTIYPAMVDSFGKRVPAIRVRPSAPQQTAPNRAGQEG